MEKVMKASPRASPHKDPRIEPKIYRESGGYSYQFVSSPPEIVKCVICHLPSKDPYLSECCGHIFCATCLQQCKTTPNAAHVCPMCKDSSFKTVSNKQIAREVRSLLVYCNNREKGCTWKGEINDINKHLENSNGCQYEAVKCTYRCKMTMQRQYLVDHMTSKCPRRKVNCQYCHINGEWQFIEVKHREECNKFPLSCPNKCEVGNVPREDMEAHRKECPHEMIQCEYHNVGCDVRMARKRRRSHLEENMETHLQMTKLKLAKTEEKLLSTEQRVNNLETMWHTLLQQGTASSSATVKTNWSSQLETLASTVLNKPCPVVIKLPQLANHLKSRNMWYSAPFYTHKDGYQMRLYVKTSDDNYGLSLGLQLMKGPHDDKLSWPLRRKFEIKLLNQISDSDHHTGMLMFSGKVAGRVTTDITQGLGFPKFIALEVLKCATKTRQFHKNDCVFFMVQNCS